MDISVAGTPILTDRDKRIQSDIQIYGEHEVKLRETRVWEPGTTVRFFNNVVGVVDLQKTARELVIPASHPAADNILQKFHNPISMNDMEDNDFYTTLSDITSYVVNKMYLTHEEITDSIIYMTTQLCNVKESIEMSKHFPRGGVVDPDPYAVIFIPSKADPRAFFLMTMSEGQGPSIIMSLKIDTDSFIVFPCGIPVLGHVCLEDLADGKDVKAMFNYNKFHFRLSDNCRTPGEVRHIELAEMLGVMFNDFVISAAMAGLDKGKSVINTAARHSLCLN